MKLQLLTLLSLFFTYAAADIFVDIIRFVAPRQIATSDAQTAITTRTANTIVAPEPSLSGSSQTTASTSDEHTANTIVSGPTSISGSSQTTATTSDEHTANTIVSGPTTINAAAHMPTAALFGREGVMGAALVGVGM
ncbi:hypothetical protein LTS18_009059, partial [Coniosporium uncinatum]